MRWRSFAGLRRSPADAAMEYEQAVRYLFSLLGSIRKENFGLERMRRLAAELGHPERGPGIIHIAGTNGKGSTAAMIETGLTVAGRTTGLYSSPHLTRINERFRIDGHAAGDDAVGAAIERVRRANESLAARYGRSAHPTFFESATAAGLCLFRDAGVAYRIVETGLGGRLDASNIVEPEIAVLTRIAFDHEAFLGGSLARIAGEKAAIIKPNCRAVFGAQDDSARRVLLERAEQCGAPAVDASAVWSAERMRECDGFRRFEAVGAGRSISVRLSLAGAHQVENAVTAIAVLDSLGIGAEAISAGLSGVKWPGRLEWVEHSRPRVLLDAAHNPSGARCLADFLAQHAHGRRVALIYGSSRGKAVDEIAGWLFPKAARVILTRSKVPRALRPETLLAVAGHHHDRIATAPTLSAALAAARRGAGCEDWIVIAGSIFLVGEARELLGCE